MDSFDHKSCPECAESIYYAAKRCSFCKSPQGKYRWLKNPALQSLLKWGGVMAVLIYTQIQTDNRPKYRFVDYAQKVQIGRAHV